MAMRFFQYKHADKVYVVNESYSIFAQFSFKQFFLSTTGYGAFFYALFPPSSNHTFHHVLTVYYDRQPE